MADNKHLRILRQGRTAWDNWRRQHPAIRPNLSTADLSKADLSFANLNSVNLSGANLSRANLSGANLSGANLCGADLSIADLSIAHLYGAYLIEADLSFADLSFAHLISADLSIANLSFTDLSFADLSFAHLTKAILLNTNLCNTNLTSCSIYGISAWDIRLEGAQQRDLVITRINHPVITIDNLEVAQFIYLLLHNPKIHDVIDTMAKKVVLILGRFTPERKPVLEALRTALRAKKYLPILFDFDEPRSQDWTETVRTLAHLSCFIIADLTDPSCSPNEIGMIAHDHFIPLQPLFQPSATGSSEFTMLTGLRQHYHWVLPAYQYRSLEDLTTSLQDKVIIPAEQKVDEIAMRRKTK